MTISPELQNTSVPSEAGILRRAEELLPLLRERAEETERNRRLSDETVAEFRAAGFHKIMQPIQFGGYGMPMTTAAECVRTLATACGSSGWIASLFAYHNFQVGLFPLQAQQEYWASGENPVCSTAAFSPFSEIEQVPGGFQLSGRWKFASGSDFASWFIIMKPSKTNNDWLLVPRADLTIEDDWFVSGLSGTGSKDLILDKVFIPEHRHIPFEDLMAGTTPGAKVHGTPLAQLPFGWSGVWGIPATLIGMAAGMAETVRLSLIGKRGTFTGELQVERPANQIALTAVLTDIHAAELIMRHRLSELEKWGANGGAPTYADAFISTRDAAYVARIVGGVAHRLALMSGANATHLRSPIQRYLRDINVGTTHASLVWESAAELYGQAAWDLPMATPGTFRPPSSCP